GLDASELVGSVAGQDIHGLDGEVESGGAVVDGQDGYALAAVGDLPAGAAVGRVPAGDGGDAADHGERGEVAQLPEAVLLHAVGAVGAGHAVEREARVAEVGVPADCRGVSERLG